jgi:hypothetical protein
MSRCIILKVRVFKGTLSRDGYFFEGLNIVFSTFCVCPDSFKVFQQLFNTIYNY